MNPDSTLRYLVSLVFVLGLIGALAWLLRRFGPRGPFRSVARRRLAIVEVAAIDARHRLILIRRDDREHLLLLGPNSDLVIEAGFSLADAGAGPLLPADAGKGGFAYQTEGLPR
jgi:flagellar protein FliO/FliZ